MAAGRPAEAGTDSPALTRLREAVGWQGPQRVDVIERRHLADYRRTLGLDPQGTDVPLTICACFLSEPPPMPAAEAYGLGWINGGDRFEYAGPRLTLGDELRSRLTFTAVSEKHGRSGTLAVLTFETEFVRPDDTVAVRHIGTRIRR
ncbi:MaoC family dehydratase N-terminal domain-containing protein [Nocardioides sp. zg-1228]|uniref:FAS1-like dehydratase domain-containing protein n=1 Tax=Nocardioides sp. zg-1228 TaxID=2763008 RepID=UPI001642E788|nr:MaoC family dehydratase N-terminal domain-containing protein [Nocardioides sp. zg-1228]MBC2935143.1 MaoC family dehydratase N-terminal domain-containing protein [Nocardioides sp. zg-1228]QSF56986.1 MaoC family dehydratase N-terminal domain-containing protein [Nocardioides sp. zg-1228]